jgi:hypothetical protein
MTLLQAVHRVLDGAHHADTEAHVFKIGIDLLDDLECALAAEEHREPRDHWNAGSRNWRKEMREKK